MLELNINTLEDFKVPLMVGLDEIEEGTIFSFKNAKSPHLFIKRQRSEKGRREDPEAVCLSLSTNRFFIVPPEEMKEVMIVGHCNIKLDITQTK